MRKGLFILFLLFTCFIYAQDDSFFFEDDFSSDEEVSNSYFNFSYGGKAGIDGRINENFKNFNGYLDLNLLIGSPNVDFSVNGDFNISSLDSLDKFPLQNSKYSASFFVDTMFLRFYHSLFDLEVGFLKPIWGNADGIHAVDVLNPLDYSDPFGGSYLDSKISQQMVKLNVPVGDSSLLEVAYLPSFKGDYIPMAGMWTPYYIAHMEDTIYEMAYAVTKQQYPTTPDEYLIDGINEKTQIIVDSLTFAETEYFTDSQAAARFTTSVNSIDLGLTYYYGFLKQPTIDPADVITNTRLKLIYNRVQTVGLDFATALGLFNFKGEAAINLTEDSDGSDSAINNNSIKYILGFDINLPVNNVNFLIQGVGNTILNDSEITTMDPQYNKDDRYTTLSVMGRLSENYLNQSLNVEVTGVYNIFDNDFMVKPKLTYSINDNAKCYMEYLLLDGDETTTFGQYKNNDTLKIGIDFTF